MNVLRNIFNSRSLNFIRQNVQNSLINIAQPVDAATTVPSSAGETTFGVNERSREPLFILKNLLDADRFRGKNQLQENKSTHSISPTTLKLYRRLQRKVDIVYRCKLCNTRNSKQVNEAAYYSGVVILQCDGCLTNHLIVDHIGWFANSKGKSFNQIITENSKSVKIIKIDQNDQLI